jgi:hypothetical protein
MHGGLTGAMQLPAIPRMEGNPNQSMIYVMYFLVNKVR